MGRTSQADVIQAVAQHCPQGGLRELVRLRKWVVWERPSGR
jgi:hypothetical protein